MVSGYNPAKSRKNKEKHGIDFEEAQILWKDDKALYLPARFDDEERFVMIASHSKKLWTAVCTIRKQNIRIISVRRARKNERKLYES